MNAAFVLMTTAWLATGDHHAASSASCGPTCNTACTTTSCDTGCNGFAHGLRHKLRGLFNRDCDSCSTCETTVHVKHHAICAPKTCAPACATTCDPCESAGHKLLGRLRGLFHRSSDCCDAGCTDSACGTSVVAPAAPAAPAINPEPTTPPKKMPSTKEPPAGKQVREYFPAQPQLIQQSAAPAVLQSQPIPEIVIPVVSNVIRID